MTVAKQQFLPSLKYVGCRTGSGSGCKTCVPAWQREAWVASGEPVLKNRKRKNEEDDEEEEQVEVELESRSRRRST